VEFLKKDGFGKMKNKLVLALGVLLIFGFFLTACDYGNGSTPGGNKVNRALTPNEADYLYSLHTSVNLNTSSQGSLVARSIDDIADAFRNTDFTFCRIEDIAEETMESDGQSPILIYEGLNGDGTYIYRFSYVVSGYKYEVFCNKEYNKDRWLTGGGWVAPPSNRFHSDSDGCWFFLY
jgi:hypothetical protein